MKIFVSNLLFTFLFSFDLSYSQNEKFVVSILDFTGEDVNPKLLRMCYQRLETSLIESNKFMVIEKGQRDEILKEQKFQASGICNDECVVEIGQLVGAEYLMLGEIIEFSGLYQIDIKIINVEQGNVEEKVTEEIVGDIKQLLEAMEKSSRKIIAKITNQLNFEESSDKLFNQKQRKISNNPIELLNEGKSSLDNNLLDDAEYYFLEALKIDPSFAPAIIALGSVMIRRNNPEKAIEYTKKGIMLDEDFHSAWDHLMKQFPYYDWSTVSPPPKPVGPKVKFIPYDDPPKPISAIRPMYPEVAQEAGIEGVVVVQAFIDKKGIVKETVILRGGIPNTGFDEAAIEAIRKTRFRPAKQRNKPVGVWISIPVNFKLK